MQMLSAFIDTFKIFPPTVGLEWLGDPLHTSVRHPNLDGAIKLFVELSGQSLLLTLQIAAPAMITLMLTDVLLGIINRGAPQVNVFALSQVVKGPIGIFALMIALIPTWNYVRDHALPRFAEGQGSIPTMARTMQCANVEAQRVEKGVIDRSDADSEACASKFDTAGGTPLRDTDAVDPKGDTKSDQVEVVMGGGAGVGNATRDADADSTGDEEVSS